MESTSKIVPEKSLESISTRLPMEMLLEERLSKFVQHFDMELESTLLLHYGILEGSIKKSGEIPNYIISILGLPANYFIIKGADKIIKLFLTPLKKPFEFHEKMKSLEYYEIVYSFYQSKENGRKVFVEIAIDLFASFELQFNGISSTRGDEKAIQRVAKCAAKRFLNAFKTIKESESDSIMRDKLKQVWRKIKSFNPSSRLPVLKLNYELNAMKVIEGKSETELISNPILTPSSYISFKCKKSHTECKNKIDEWKISEIFDKVGVAEKGENSENYDVYETHDSHCEKYGYRFRFQGENLDDHSLKEMCKNTCMHPDSKKNRDFYVSEREIILNIINSRDPTAMQNKLITLVEEIKENSKNNENFLKSELQAFNSLLTEIITKYSNDIQEQLMEAKKHRDVLAIENNEIQQTNKDEIVSHLSDVKEKIVVESIKNSESIAENKELLLENMKTTVTMKSDFKQLNEKIENITTAKNRTKRVLFRLKKPTMTFEGREKELENLHEILMKKTSAVISQAASIVGLGGIGKTELAKKYIEKYHEYYYNIIFINAEKSETLLESFRMLADKIEIKLISNDGKDRDIKYIVEDIYEHLNEGGKTLIVFDNAEEFKIIKTYIFDISFGNDQIHTLITSRCKNWEIGDMGIIEEIELAIFTEIEATNYLRKSLANENDEDLKSLIDLLQRLPLGLKQAVGFIKQQNAVARFRGNSNIFKIKDYINLFQEKWKEILQRGLGEVGDLYEKTIATTWRVTLQKIEENDESGKLALSILKIIAYLAPDDIKVEKIFTKLEKDIDKLFQAVHLLDGYSIINNEEGIVNVHRLVQKAIQLYLIELKDEENVLKEALKLLQKCGFIEHVVSLWEHVSNYPEIVKNDYHVSKYDNTYDHYYDKSPVELLIMHRKNTIAINKILKCIEIDFNKIAIFASQKGNREVLEFLIENGADINYKNRLNQSLLYSATIDGTVEVLQFLISKGLDVNIADENGFTPLLFAAYYTKIEPLKLLLESGANPNVKNSYGETLLYFLIRNEAVEELKYALKKGTDINIRNVHGKTPLHWAVSYGNFNILQILLDEGLNIDIADNYGETPLLFAAKNKRTEALKFLIKSGADLNAKYSNGETILHLLVKNDSIEEFKLVLSKGLNPNIQNKNGQSLLHLASEIGSVNIMQFLIEKSFNVNMTDKFGKTPLIFATFKSNLVLKDHLKTIKILVENGADPKLTTNDGTTLIHFATYEMYVNDFNFVMELGFDLTVVNKNGDSLLHSAVRGENENMIRYLVSEGINPNVTNKFGCTPLHYCFTKRYVNFAAKLLIELGANPNALSKFNCTPLHFAAAKNCVVTAEVLIEKGAEINCRNQLERTPLHYASAKCHQNTIKFLLSEGAEVNVLDSKRRTPLHHLLRNSKFTLMEELLKHGANPLDLDKAGNSLLHLAAIHMKYKYVNSVVKNIKGFDVNGRSVDGKTPMHLAAECGRVSIVGLLVRNGGDISAMDKSGSTPLDLAIKFNRTKVVDFISKVKSNLSHEESEENGNF